MTTEIWMQIPGERFDGVLCRGCGCPMVFVRNPKTDNFVPLDLSTTTRLQDKTWEAQSHFQTCPNAKDFSRKGKKP